MKAILIFLFTIAYTISFAQPHPSCDGNKYRADVFTNVEILTDIKFGENYTYSDNFKELFLDFYQPVGDSWTGKRPLLILAFGGSFITGTRQDLDFLCKAYAAKGYAVATIDYRLYDALLFPLPTADIMIDVVTKAVADFKASIRFFKEDASKDNLYNIDPDYIFIGGVSAGSIAAAHAAVMDTTDVDMTNEILATIRANGGIDGTSSDNLAYDSEVKGFINFSGGLHKATWFDENDPQLFSVHEDMDPTVPYGNGFASIFGFDIISLQGSSILQYVADSVSVNNGLFTFTNADSHVEYFLPNNQAGDGKMVIDLSADFTYDIVCEGFVSSIDDELLNDVKIYPNPNSGIINVIDEANIVERVEVYASSGLLIKSCNYCDQLDISEEVSGLYLVKLYKTKATKTIKFIKK